MLWTWVGLGIACFVVVVVLWLEHWFDWPRWLGHELGAPWTYVAGVLTLAAAYSAWMAAVQVNAWPMALIGLWAIVVVGGLAVQAAYQLDRLGGILQDWRTSRGKVDSDGGDGSGAIRPR